jgi:N4-gp56 family major capsid protein
MAYTPDPTILATPFAELAPVIQDGVVSQAIKNSLQQNLVFGSEFMEKEAWTMNVGQTITVARDAPMAPTDEPKNPNVAPTYKPPKYEETLASVAPYGDAIKLDMLQSAATIKGYAVNRLNTLGRNAANSMNAIRRKALYSGYLGGHAVALATEGASSSLLVSTINGFQKQINSDGKWLNVSSDNPKPIMIGAGTYALVIGVAALSALFPAGRGTLTLSANAAWTINDPVVAMDAPYRIYQGGGTTVDAISSTDILTLDSLRQALALHDENGIPPHEDGTYWVHMGPRVKPQLWADPEFQNVIKGGVATTQFGNYELTRAMGCTFISNQQVPTRSNASALQNSRISTTSAKLSKSIYGEIVNRNGIELGHTLVTGGGLGKTWYMPQGQLASAAGNMNATEYYGMKVSADNMSMMVDEMVRFLILAPNDDNRQNVPANWQFIGSFMLWNDLFGGTYSPNADAEQTRNPYYKRAVPITHYAG